MNDRGINYYFKKTFSGMVLMKQFKHAVGGVGNWEYTYSKATEAEAQEYLMNRSRDDST